MMEQEQKVVSLEESVDLVSPSRNVWGALILVPFILGICFFPLVAYLSHFRGLEGDGLLDALEPLAAYPATAGFRVVGWSKPEPVDLLIGLVGGLLLWALNSSLVYPALMELRPDFDPTLSVVPFGSLFIMLGVAVVAEDTLYRGYALVTLEKKHGTAGAICATSFFYALVAPGEGWPLMAWAFGFGALLCLVRLWRGNLWPVVMIHRFVAMGTRLGRFISGEG